MNNVLIVSADPHHAALLGGHLASAGFQVQVLESGARALSAIHHQKPGLVLLDWRLPDLSSLALIRMIRADEQAARVPLVLVGGLNDGMGVEERLAGFDTGADLCLEEPIQPREFVARLRALLRRV